MDTTKQQGLVARHEHVDARVWNQFYGGWFPLAPWSGLDVSYRAELGVSQGKATVPLSHPCANIFRQMRDGVPAPLSIEVNGVFISGQITYAQAESDGEKQVWDLTIELDQKHAHSMLVRAPIQSAADSSDTRISGFLGPVARQLIAGASSRTGLPTYVLVDGEGDPVDVSARNDDTVAGVLEPALSGSNLFVDVRMLLPGQKIPGVGPVERFAGNLERQWENAALDAGLWPHAETNPRITDMVAGPDGLVPPMSWHGVASHDYLGNELAEPVEGYVWVPFATQAPYIGSDYYNPEREPTDDSRVITPAQLEAHAAEFPGWSSYVTEWAAGATLERERDAFTAAANEELLELGDGSKPSGGAVDVHYEVLRYVGAGEAYAWRDGPVWKLFNAADMQVERAKRAANLEQKQTPGVLFHFYGERDRREIVFSSVPGGGLKRWSIGYAAPSAAMLIAGAQLDEWTMQQMGIGALPEQAITGEQSSVPADASAMKNIPPVVDQIDVDVQPQARLEGSDVAYHAAGGRVDLSKAGPFFYREKYLNLGNSGTMNPVQQMVQEWGKSQGSTTASFTPAGNQNVVFGDDIIGADGRVIKGWRHGDRVSFVDGDTRVSEIIIGWRLVANAGQPLDVSPILGREDHGVMAQLGDRIRGSEKASRKNQLAPPRRLPVQEIEDTFNREASEWSRIVQEQLDEGRQHVEDAEAWATAALEMLADIPPLLDDAELINQQIEGNLLEVQGLHTRVRSLVQRGQGFVTQAYSAVALAQSYNVEISKKLVEARQAVSDGLANVAAAEILLELVIGPGGYIDQAEQILVDTRTARNAATGALSDMNDALNNVDGDGTSFAVAVAAVLTAHNDILDKHGQVLSLHNRAIRVTARAVQSANSAASYALLGVQRLSEAIALMQQANIARDEAILAAASAASDALTVGEKLTTITERLATNQELQVKINRLLARAISINSTATAFATQSAQSAGRAAGAALEAIGAMQEAFLKQEEATQAASDSAFSAQESAEKSLEAQRTGWAKHITIGTPNNNHWGEKVMAWVLEDGNTARVGRTPGQDWAGEIFAKAYFTNNTIQAEYATVPTANWVILGGGTTAIKYVEVEYRDWQRTGRYSRDESWGWQLPENNKHFQRISGSPWNVTFPTATEVNAILTVTWSAAAYDGAYEIQARVNGTAVKTVRNTGFGPQFPWLGSGKRTQLLALTGTDTLSVSAGDTLSFWVRRDRSGATFEPGQRYIEDLKLSVSWSEPEA